MYIVDPNGRLQLGQAFEAVDDQAAGLVAGSLARPGLMAELWQGGRMVGQISAEGVYSHRAGQR